MPRKSANKENTKSNEKTLEEHTVVELRAMLKKVSLDTKGKKSELIARINERY
jgi:hypothetical protein